MKKYSTTCTTIENRVLVLALVLEYIFLHLYSYSGKSTQLYWTAKETSYEYKIQYMYQHGRLHTGCFENHSSHIPSPYRIFSHSHDSECFFCCSVYNYRDEVLNCTRTHTRVYFSVLCYNLALKDSGCSEFLNSITIWLMNLLCARYCILVACGFSDLNNTELHIFAGWWRAKFNQSYFCPRNKLRRYSQNTEAQINTAQSQKPWHDVHRCLLFGPHTIHYREQHVVTQYLWVCQSIIRALEVLPTLAKWVLAVFLTK